MKLFRGFIIFTITALFVCLVSAQSWKSNDLFRKGVDSYKSGNYDEAIRLFEQCKELDEKELPQESNRKYFSDVWIASSFYKKGDIEKAKAASRYYYAPPIDRALTVISDSLQDIGDRFKDEDPETTLKYYLEALEYEKPVFGEDHPLYANTLCNIGALYFEMDEMDEAADYFNKGVAIHRQAPFVDEYLAKILHHGGVINFYAGRIEEALDMLRQRVEICNRLADIDSIMMAQAYCDYAMVEYQVSQSYTNCIDNQKKGLDIYRKILADDDETIVQEENVLTRMLADAGRLSECAEILEHQVERIERLQGKGTDEWLEKIDVLSYIYKINNQIDKAIAKQIQYADELRLMPDRKKELGEALANLARYMDENGNSAEALNIIEESCALYEAMGDTASSGYMSALNTAASVYLNLLMINKAMENITKVLEIGKNYGLEDDDQYTKALNLAMILADKAGLDDLASDLNMRVFERLLNKEEAVDSVALATNIQNQASILISQGEYDEALQYIYKALSIQASHLGRDHPDFASSCNTAANLAAKMGDKDMAIDFLDQTVRIYRPLNHANYTFALRNRGLIHLELGHKEEALRDITEAIGLTNDKIRNEFSFLSPAEQKYFWREYREFYEGKIPLYTLELNHPVMNANAFDALLLTKGILLNTEISLRHLLLESNDRSLIEKYNRLIDIQTDLNNQYRLAENERTADVNLLQRDMEALQRDLVNSSKAYGNYTSHMSITMQDVQEKMAPEDVAIEFMRIEPDEGPAQYAALVLKKAATFPALVVLCDEEQLRPYAFDPTNVDDGGLYSLIWEPLEPHLNPGGRVYFSPAGTLHELSLENASTPNGNLLSSRYHLNRLSSTREIAFAPTPAEGRATLFGNINYNASINDMIAAAGNIKPTSNTVYDTELLAAADIAKENSRSLADRFAREGDSEIVPLPGTKREIDAILPLLSKSTKYEGNEATETTLKALSGTSPAVLHIATHGIYYSEEDSQEADLDFMRFDREYSNVANREDETLSRSGLLMTGASNAFFNYDEIPADIDDGVVTAQEISLLDLRGLDLVTLSACDTGRGEINGDGVFGLQRGFKKAGAQSILMSLWKVDDNATCMLMTEFYKNWNAGLSKYEALEKAKETVRTQPDWGDPKYWAAFILLDAIN